MPKSLSSPLLLRGLSLGLVLVQIFDVIIHAATNQLEPIRVTANIIILLWLVAINLGRFKANFLPLAFGSIGAYLVLNLIFLAREGPTNPAQDNEPRVMLFLLLILTLILSTWLAYLCRQHQSN
jgi:hypothetical protein